MVHQNVAASDIEPIITSSVVSGGTAYQQNQPSAVLRQVEPIPASQTVSLSPDANQQPCPQPSQEPDTLSIPAVLNTLFGGESSTNHIPQPLYYYNNIPLGATVSAKLKQNIWDNSYFGIQLLISNQHDNVSVSVQGKQSIFNKVNSKIFPIPLTNKYQHFSFMRQSLSKNTFECSLSLQIHLHDKR